MYALVQIGLANAIVAIPAALFAAIVSRLIHRPALAHVLWLLVLLKLLTPPLFQIPISILPAERPAPSLARATPTHRSSFDNVITVSSSSRGLVTRELHAARPISVLSRTRSDSVPPTLQDHSSKLLAFLFLVWSVGSACCAMIVAIRTIRFERLLCFAAPAPPDVVTRVNQMARRLRLRDVPAAFVVPGVVCPMLWSGIRGPRLLLPTALWDQLDSRQRDTVLLHELAHLRRRDHWVRWVEAAVTILFWWFPICWWARYELREAEEQCCDAWVMRILPEHFHSYADALLATATFVSSTSDAPLLATGTSQFVHLKRRLMLIKEGGVRQNLSASGKRVAVVFAILLLPVIPKAAKLAAAPVPMSSAGSAAPSHAPTQMTLPNRSSDGDRAGTTNDLQKELDLMESRACQMLQEVRALRAEVSRSRLEREPK